jgi:hypothetical protein
LIGKVNLFPKLMLPVRNFFLSTITSLYIVYYNFTNAYKTKTLIKMGTLSYFGPIVGLSQGMP